MLQNINLCYCKKKYQSMLIDVICYEMKNILFSNNNHRFKPTSYEYRIFYKTTTIVKPYKFFFNELIYMSFVYLFFILFFWVTMIYVHKFHHRYR